MCLFSLEGQGLPSNSHNSSWKSQVAPPQCVRKTTAMELTWFCLQAQTPAFIQVAPRHPCDGGIEESEIRPQGDLSFWAPFKCWLVNSKSKIFALGHKIVSSRFVIPSHLCVSWMLELPIHLGEGNNW